MSDFLCFFPDSTQVRYLVTGSETTSESESLIWNHTPSWLINTKNFFRYLLYAFWLYLDFCLKKNILNQLNIVGGIQKKINTTIWFTDRLKIVSFTYTNFFLEFLFRLYSEISKYLLYLKKRVEQKTWKYYRTIGIKKKI